MKNYSDLICIALTMSYSKYWCLLPRKNYIYALISRIHLSDIGMDDLRAKSSHLGVYGTNIH